MSQPQNSPSLFRTGGLFELLGGWWERKRNLAGLDGKIFIGVPSENLFLEERETALFV